jgi:hypothetical protein
MQREGFVIQPALTRLWGQGALASALLIRLILGVCLVGQLDSRVATAQEVSDPKREAEYQELINYALEEYDRGSWEESAALFYRAHELAPSARTLRGLGLATYEARRYAESVRHLRAALTDKRRPLTDKQREEVEATLDRAKLFVGHLQIDTTPRDAQLTINGRNAEPETDGSYMVDSGFVDLEASAPGYQNSARRVRIGGGELQKITLRLVSLAPEPERVARSAPVLPEPAEVTPAPMRLQPTDSSPLSTWKWVAGTGAVLALATGGTMLAVQRAKAPAYERDCADQSSAAPRTDCDSRHALLGETLWYGSIISLSIGGALAALTVTLFVLDASHHSDSPSAANHPRLMCSGGPLGVACSGQF